MAYVIESGPTGYEVHCEVSITDELIDELIEALNNDHRRTYQSEIDDELIEWGMFYIDPDDSEFIKLTEHGIDLAEACQRYRTLHQR